MKPNLFTFATSELSQDAFLCWLLAWADEAAAAEDPELHGVGTAFVDALFGKAGITTPTAPLHVEVLKQVKGVDVVALVADTHVLVIEDKTMTSNHSDQLNRYRKAIGAKYARKKIVPIYLKTFDQSSYSDIEGKGWTTFSRGDLLAVLRKGRGVVDNAIFIDFLDHLEGIEAAVQSYATLQPCHWAAQPLAWRGFYRALQHGLGQGQWGYVPNRSGGFMGFWWGWWKIPGGALYLLLEEGKFAIKVNANKGTDRGELRNGWMPRVLEKLGEQGFKRPHRLGHGENMAVAVCTRDYRKVGDDGCLDLEATVGFLQQLTVIVQEVAASVEG